MAGKRKASTVDHMIYSKVLQMEAEPRNCAEVCHGTTSPEELLAYRAFLTYSLPGSEGPDAPNPWSSATTYLQYASNALSQQMRADVAPGRRQRHKDEGVKSYPLPPETTETHFQGQQYHPVLGYPVPAPIGCPTLAVPRPVYRSPSSYMDAGHGPQGLTSLGIHVGSQQLCPPTAEWVSPAHFTYQSPPVYGTGAQKTSLPPQMGHAESRSRGMQELSPAHRQWEGTSAPAVLPPAPPAYTDCFPSLPRANMLYAQGDAPRPSGSAFIPPSHPHNYRSRAFQGGLDSRMGQLHSTSHYSPTGDCYPHRHSPRSCSVDTALLPTSGRGTITQADREMRVGATHADRDPRVGATHADLGLRVGAAHVDRELRVGAAHMDRQLRVGASHVDRQLRVGVIQADRGLRVAATNVDRELWVGATHADCLLQQSSSCKSHVQSPHLPFLPQDPTSYLTPALTAEVQLRLSTPSLIRSPVRERSLAPRVSVPHGAFRPLAACGVKETGCGPSPAIECIRRSNLNAEHLRPAMCSGLSSPYRTREEDLRGRSPEVALLTSLHRELLPTPPARDLETDAPPSPPMPVINNVFSLAPYRAYLEGTAPYPLTPRCRQAGGKNISTFPILLQPTPDRPETFVEGTAEPSAPDSTLEISNTEHRSHSSNKCTGAAQPGHTLGSSLPQTEVEEVVLDLSLKKSPPLNCFPQDLESCPPQAAMSCPPQAAMSCPPQAALSCPHETALSCPPQAAMSCSTKTPILCPPKKNAPCPLQSPAPCPPQSPALCPPQSPALCPPQSPALCPPQSPALCPPQSPALCPPQSPAFCPPKSPSHLTLQAPAICPPTLYIPQLPSQPSEFVRERWRHPSDCSPLLTPPTATENDNGGFHSSKSFMFRKYKMKVAPTGGETQEEATAAVAQALPGSFLLPPKVTQSLPHCTPVSSPTLGEANVASGKATQKGSGHHFAELHRSARAAITSSVRGSPPELLEDWLAKTKEEEERPKSPVKSKSSSRVTDPSQHSPGRNVWLAFDGVRLLLRKLLSQLETFMFPQSCPFPHVIRAGAVFIPIHLVKERMFRELPVASVDRVLQRHKVELRPTTLSEEKLLRDTELRDCSSRMLKLLALKQLPDVYPDLLHLYWGHCVQRQLGSSTQSGLHAHK
ncbi:uncharacterized protein C15orf39 homolog isoform X2 [Ascaphus truei]|uniref:uncharacterized protein C15orf39 homolog isoform X2 n=1 Tax=Ascaphus truei TaxID=8439 RepID=UPI003F5A274F